MTFFNRDLRNVPLEAARFLVDTLCLSPANSPRASPANITTTRAASTNTKTYNTQWFGRRYMFTIQTNALMAQVTKFHVVLSTASWPLA